MKSRDVVRLFFSTLLIGGVSTVVVSLFSRWNEYMGLVRDGEVIQIFSLLLWFLCVGFMFSLVSQMGLFAYLTIHRLGLSFFKSKGLWDIVQVVLILVALGDFLFFQSLLQSSNNQGITVVGLCIIAILVGYLKVVQTNKAAFVPSIFFMIVVTLIEWIPVIQADNNENWLYNMLVPLLICNGYQLFMLGYQQKKSYPVMSNLN